MEFKKNSILKRASIVAVSLALSLPPIKQLLARENEPSKTAIKTGLASWYHDKFQGRKTANGDIFSQKKLTCASNVYPLGTWLRVTNIKNGKSVIVRVNDRMAKRMKRVVDLSKAAARSIGIGAVGISQVKVQSFGKQKPEVNS